LGSDSLHFVFLLQLAGHLSDFRVVPKRRISALWGYAVLLMMYRDFYEDGRTLGISVGMRMQLRPSLQPLTFNLKRVTLVVATVVAAALMMLNDWLARCYCTATEAVTGALLLPSLQGGSTSSGLPEGLWESVSGCGSPERA
jgi:hypothetical protein